MRVRVDVFVCKSVRVVEGVNAWVCVCEYVREWERVNSERQFALAHPRANKLQHRTITSSTSLAKTRRRHHDNRNKMFLFSKTSQPSEAASFIAATFMESVKPIKGFAQHVMLTFKISWMDTTQNYQPRKELFSFSGSKIKLFRAAKECLRVTGLMYDSNICVNFNFIAKNASKFSRFFQHACPWKEMHERRHVTGMKCWTPPITKKMFKMLKIRLDSMLELLKALPCHPFKAFYCSNMSFESWPRGMLNWCWNRLELERPGSKAGLPLNNYPKIPRNQKPTNFFKSLIRSYSQDHLMLS